MLFLHSKYNGSKYRAWLEPTTRWKHGRRTIIKILIKMILYYLFIIKENKVKYFNYPIISQYF